MAKIIGWRPHHWVGALHLGNSVSAAEILFYLINFKLFLHIRGGSIILVSSLGAYYIWKVSSYRSLLVQDLIFLLTLNYRLKSVSSNTVFRSLQCKQGRLNSIGQGTGSTVWGKENKSKCHSSGTYQN